MSQPKLPLPSLRQLTAELRARHDAWSHPDVGGEYVSLCLAATYPSYTLAWEVIAAGQISMACAPGEGRVYGREFIPGSVERACSWCSWEGGRVPCFQCHGSGRVHAPSPFDAVAAARRLLAAARDGICRSC